ncbi:hypothetical protein MTBBW1_90021 [Desulfamplus magnetovallimortis]|uniref:Uncharacterized protein n=1 Tax=Desulfamplus magnetovallimortis TaxID=1246637 RepID=A0A1W1HKX4_9BACT|nr:hypothetical protein [Desulfamplus magnetovallimortis]SLM33119.1 hypothetical protein MTBBW1_90021 [Desulfamplus magnetovallimortis]
MENNSSQFISGLIVENKDSLAGQLGLWHHLTFRNIMQHKFTGWLSNEDLLGDYLSLKSASASRLDPVTLRIWKLNEILRFCTIDIPEFFDIHTLHSTGLEIEFKTVELYRKVDKGFQGTSSNEMVQHLLGKIIQGLSEIFRQKDADFQKDAVKKVMDILQSMPEDAQEEIKNILGIDNFSHETVRRALYDQSLGVAITTLITMGRYTVYLAGAKIAIALSGVASFYIAKPLLQSLLPAIFLFLSPVAVASIGIGLTWLTDVFANRQIRSFILPVMVMGSILSSMEEKTVSMDDNVQLFLEAYNSRKK